VLMVSISSRKAGNDEQQITERRARLLGDLRRKRSAWTKSTGGEETRLTEKVGTGVWASYTSTLVGSALS